MPNTSRTTKPIATRLPVDVFNLLADRARKSGLAEEEVCRGVNIRARNIIVQAVRHDMGRNR
jgi:hypothetical protein